MAGEAADKVMALLGAQVPSLRFDSPSAVAGSGPCLEARADGRRFVIRIMQVGSRRIDEVLGALARAILEARHAAEQAGGEPVAAVWVPKVGARMADQAQAFLARYAPEAGWLLADAAGGLRLSVPALGLDLRRKPRAGATEPRRTDSGLFSDLSQWLLKIILLRDAPEAWWAGPRPSLESTSELAGAAQVSLAKAYRFVATMSAAGYLRQDDGLQLARLDDLFESWFVHHRLHPPHGLPVRCLYGPPGGVEGLARGKLSPDHYAVAGLHACRCLGLLHAPLGRLEVHALGDLEALLRDGDLEPCDARDADFVLLRGRAPESVRRGRLSVGGLSVVDPLQAALDAVVHEARGREQADYLRERIMAWYEPR